VNENYNTPVSDDNISVKFWPQNC